MFVVYKGTTPVLPYVVYDIYGAEVTSPTGLTTKLCKAGGSYSTVTRTMTQKDEADYGISLDAADTDTLGVHVFKITGSGYLPTRIAYSVVDTDVQGDVIGKVLGNGSSVIAADGVQASSVTGNLGGNVAGSVGSVTGNVGGNLAGNVLGYLLGNVKGLLEGDLSGKVLGGGSSTITGTGARVVDASGNALAPAATALSSAVWTSAKAALLDAAISTRLAAASYTAPDNDGIASVLSAVEGLPEQVASAGDAMTLADGAIKASTFAAGAMTGDAASDGYVAKISADVDLSTIVEMLDDLIAALGTPGSGAVEVPLLMQTAGGTPVEGVDVWLCSDSAGTTLTHGPYQTNSMGVTYPSPKLEHGTRHYVFAQKDGVNGLPWGKELRIQ